ncbi:fatty acid-2 hydroxylase [Exidia glandulosa HHB12029]|uniref:Ceramide very long chain fatty acid hydroxylase n=1 Tax=Exidia glandulosa HHB12029 TaxID=1314781 RepID=A0A165BJD0_EXIGL|nr:fatty acid-2 hydroxylase [Exidia glandulosa HHB12029]
MSELKSRRPVKIFTLEDVEQHKSQKDCWITRNGVVYDVTDFIMDHPGGEDLILNHAGTDVGAVMADPGQHEHSSAAYDMLAEYAVGRIGSGHTTVSDDWVATDDFHPDDTNTVEDFEKSQFLDLRKPLLPQVWFSNFSKSYYLQQVHNPRHLSKSARLFGPGYLEVFTLTSWYVVPIFWLPIATFLFFRSAAQFSAVPGAFLPVLKTNPLDTLATLNPVINSISDIAYARTLACFLTGNIIWTLLEYTLHRFLFHIDAWLPDKPVFLTLHFLLHGVHHYLPMDRYRLVMPPPLFMALSFPFTRLGYALFPTAVANGIICGAFTFYVLYDCMHYALHHTQLPQYMREMKKYHLAHHYKNFELGFGVTSKIWDIVFNTVLPV